MASKIEEMVKKAGYDISKPKPKKKKVLSK
jgi:hypothetical protein